MTDYTLGFGIDYSAESVLLVKKAFGPKCNIEKWNGIGGKVEEEEEHSAAMLREWREESGVMMTYLARPMIMGPSHWFRFGTCVGEDWEMSLFSASLSLTDLRQRSNDVGEELEWFHFSSVFAYHRRHQFAENVPVMLSRILTGRGDLRLDL